MNQLDDQNKEQRRYFIPVDGKYYETTKEVYEVYYQMERRERYLEERDIKKGVQTFSDISDSNYSADEIIEDTNVDVGDTAITNILIETVLETIMTLDEEEKWLIQELFFYGKSEVVLAQETGIARTTLQSKKYKAFEKIKKIMKI
jgi:DNA-directed RNA polymerase specialized sigma subunit